jgi:hypothetical protein
MPDKGGDPFSLLDRHWRWWTTFFWLGISIWFVMENWARIRGFSLSDTDDNMRMMQVRALLDGQGWYDLQQHRMAGSNIHWSRLVDLPIAGLRLLFTPFAGRETAETIAAAAAPLLPMLVAMLAIALIARRLISPYAYLLALVFLACGGSVTGMWQPLRLDHHGWQLAFLAWTAAALTDPRPLRAGITLGAATALSLVIGLEMILYLAAAGAIAVLMWIRDGEPRRLFAYGVTLAGGCALGFLVFTSEANRLPMCDALSPVWLSTMVAAGALAVLLAWASPKSWQGRLGAAALAGVVIAGAFALTWPHCLGRLEQSSPDLERLWLSKVREAMPIWRHGASQVVLVLTLSVAGLIGGIAMLHVTRRERDREAFIRWAAITLLAAMAAALLAWQTRASPAAQLLAVPGATAFAWIVLSLVMTLRHMVLRVGGIALIALVAVGFARGWFTAGLAAPPNPGRRAVDNASYLCASRWGMNMIDAQPRGMVLTHVDLGPRLITMTHHDAVTGPYHRNARQIVDVMLAFRSGADNARATAARYHADYVLVCPHMAESTIYQSEAPKGFYVQLMQGRVPAWLTPVRLPRDAPYRMWRVVRTPPAQAAPPAAQTPPPRRTSA